jgi:hypothetical protein
VSGPPLPAGRSDRLRAVLSALDEAPPLELSTLTFLGGRALLPPFWQRLCAALSACGVTVRDGTDVAEYGHQCDPRRVQLFLSSGTVEPLIADGSLVLLGADTGLFAAEAVADWLAAGSEEQLADTVVICQDGDTAVLDALLRARGLPTLGQSSYSPAT